MTKLPSFAVWILWLIFVVFIVSIAWPRIGPAQPMVPALAPPPPLPMSLDTIQVPRATGFIITLTNRIEEYHVQVINGKAQTNYSTAPRDYFYERVELYLMPGGVTHWRQVRQ